MAILGIGDFETGNTSQWRTLQVGSGGTLQATTTAPRQGTHCLHCKINPNDGAWSGSNSGRRAKVSMLQNNVDRVNSTNSPNIFYGLSLKFHANFPNPDGWLFATEWHSIEPTQQGPPLGFYIQTNGRMDMRWQGWHIPGDRSDFPLLPAGFAKGVWHDFVVEVLWRCNTSGLLRVWHKLATDSSYGNAKINQTGIQTAQVHSSQGCQGVYSMCGLYRTATTNNTYEMWADGYVVATTFEEAANHAHGTGSSPDPTGMIPTTNWQVAEVTSQQTDMAPFGHAHFAFDGALNTAWVTQWSSGGVPNIAQRPHQLKIDMGQVHWVGTVHLANKGVINPPWNGWEMKGYNVWGSANNVDWGDVMAIGNLPNEAGWHNIPTTPKQVRYLWIYSITSYPNSQGNDEGSVLAEIGMSPTAAVVNFEILLNLNPSSVVVSGGRVTQWNSSVGSIVFQRHNPDGDPIPGPLWEPALNAVKGDGAGFLVTNTPIITGGATRTIFLSCRRQSGDHNDNVLFILGDLWQGDGTFFQIDNALTVKTGNANAFFDVSLSTTEFQIVRIELHGNNLNTVKLFLNGTERTRTSAHSFILNTNSGPSGVLGRLHTDVPQVRSSSYIRAVRVYQGVPTAAQAATIEGELAAIGEDVPVINPISNVNTTAGQTIQFNIVASSTSQAPTITVERQDGGAAHSGIVLGTPQFSGTQTTQPFTWATTNGDPGTYPLRARATISGGVTATRDFTITISEFVDTPTINPISNVTVNEGQTINFNIVASGQQSPPGITVERQDGSAAPPGIVLGQAVHDNNQTTRPFTWATSNGNAGTYLLRGRATLPSASATANFTVTINQVISADPPVFTTSPPSLSVKPGDQVSFQTVATHSDGWPTQTLTRNNGTSPPSGIAFALSATSATSSTYQFSWTPQTEGNYALMITAEQSGKTTTAPFTLTVETPTAGPQAPPRMVTVPSSTRFIEVTGN